MLGEINNVTSDKNSEKGAEESGAPNPHFRRPSHDETDMRPVSQPAEIIFMETPQNMPMEGNGVPGPLSPEAPSGRALPLVLIHSGGRPQVLLQAAALILLDGTLCGDFGLWTSAGSSGADVQTVGFHHFVISPGTTDPPHAGETVEETRHVRPFFRHVRPFFLRPHPHFFVLVRAKTFSGGKMANFDDPFDVASAEWMLEDPTGAAGYPGTQNLATVR